MESYTCRISAGEGFNWAKLYLSYTCICKDLIRLRDMCLASGRVCTGVSYMCRISGMVLYCVS